MGRRKVELKRIENNTYRHISFSKRKTGLIKKAYELSTMCDTEVALILFSPAGKLFLYEGKKRIEDTLQQYMDLPERQRGRLHNPELIRGIIAQLALEWSIFKKEKLGFTDSHTNIESLVQGLTNEMDACSSQLEEVEKQLTFFVESGSLVQKLADQTEEQEDVLEWVLGLLRMRKQVIEGNEQVCSQQGLPQRYSTGGSFDMGGSSSYNIFNNSPPETFIGGKPCGQSFLGGNPPSQSFQGGNYIPPMQPQPNFPPIEMTSAFDFGFQPFSNESLNYAGDVQPPQNGLQEMSMDCDRINGPTQFGAFVGPQPQPGFADASFPSAVDFLPNVNLPACEQASASSNVVQSNVGDSPLCSFGACQHSECGNPFGF